MNNLDDVAPEDEPRAYRNKSYPAAHAGDHRRVADAHAHRHRAACSRCSRSTASASRAAVGSASACAEAGPAASGGPARPTTSSSRSTASAPTSSRTEFVRDDPLARSPATRSTVVVERDGRAAALRRHARHQPERRPDVRHRLPRGQQRRARRCGATRRSARRFADSAERTSRTVAWQSITGVVKVLNPVNDRRAPHRHQRRPDARARARSSASRRASDDIGDRDRVRRHAADCSPCVNVFVGAVQHVPAAAVRRRPRGDRHVRAASASRTGSRRTAPTSTR